MTTSDSRDEPPDENEAYANLDESLDEEDRLRPGGGPEGQRDLDSELVVDRTELLEAGANLDDPERMSLLDGGMDDPDGTGPPPEEDDDEAGWDVDPRQRITETGNAGDDIGADGDAIGADLIDVADFDEDDSADSSVSAGADQVPDDAPGLDGGRG